MKHKLLTVLFALVAALFLCLGLAACGGKGDKGGKDGDSGNVVDTETHTWSAWDVTKEATCTEEGSRTRTCSDCGKVETETIPANDHTYNESNVCTVCGYELSPTVGLEYELYEETEYPQGEYYLVKGMGTATDRDLVIPAYHAGKKVRRIGANAFNGKDALTSIYIPNGVEVIGMNAFSYCISLTSLRLPNSVKTIGKQAFYGCNKIQDITLGTNGITIVDGAFGNTAYYQNDKNWESGALYIGVHLIATNNDLPSSYTIKDGTRSIASRAFANRSGLEEIIMPSSYTLGTNLFDYCYKLTKATAHFNSMEALPADQIIDLTVSGGTIYKSESTNNLFRKFRNLENLFVDTDWKDRSGTYGNEKAPLAGLGKLKNLRVKWLYGRYDIYPMHTLFGDESYSGSVEIKQDGYVNNQTKENYYTAYLPAGLETVTVLEGNIGLYAFSNCTMIKRFNLGEKIGKVEMAFLGCSSDVRINYEGTLKQWVEQEKGGGWAGLRDVSYSDDIYTPKFADFTIQNKPLSKVDIPNGVTTIAAYAFSGCKIDSITIPDSVTEIGSHAFYYCSGLMSVTIGSGVTEIGDDAFAYCSGLTSVTIGSGVTEIGSYAFWGCSGLTSIDIPDSVTEIGDDAFYGTAYYNDATNWDESGVLYIGNHLIAAKTTISGAYTIRENTKTIADRTFRGCSGLTSIIIPNSVTKIGERAFEDCSGLTSITIPDSVTSIGDYAFRECSGLTSVTIGNGVTEIGDEAFYDCRGLTSIVIPDSVTSIGKWAFYNCDWLTSITIPDSVTEIGDHAFAYCSGLTSVTIGNGVTSIGERAFYDCRGLTNIQFMGTVKEWQAIEKGNYWDNNIGNYTVTCTDGKIAKNGTVTMN